MCKKKGAAVVVLAVLAACAVPCFGCAVRTCQDAYDRYTYDRDRDEGGEEDE